MRERALRVRFGRGRVERDEDTAAPRLGLVATAVAAISRCTLAATLACFVLPFLTLAGVSGCDGGATTTASYTGAQLATFSGPSVRTLDEGDGPANVKMTRFMAGTALASAVITIIGGLAYSLVRPERRFAALTLAGLVGATLVLASVDAVLMPPSMDSSDGSVDVVIEQGMELTAVAMIAASLPALTALMVAARGTRGPGLLSRRIGASLLDMLVLLPATAIALFGGLIIGWTGVAIACWYSVRSAGTVGQRVFELQVVGRDGSPPGTWRMAFRFAAKVAGLVTLTGILVPLVAPGRRGLADLVTETHVVRWGSAVDTRL
jgi:uncharacterized RDD family membrane protein YckC